MNENASNKALKIYIESYNLLNKLQSISGISMCVLRSDWNLLLLSVWFLEV